MACANILFPSIFNVPISQKNTYNEVLARCQFCLLTEITNKNQEEILGSSGSLFEKNPKYLVSKSKITGIPAETVDINSVEHHSLATHL